MVYISKSRFINWTRCPMYFAMELKHNPSGMEDIDAERERREEMLAELKDGISSAGSADEEEESFDASPSEELKALLPYYHRVEDEALKVAQKYFKGSFIADSEDVRKQKLFEYERGGHTYRCYVDIYNENADEVNIIEVKAATNSKYIAKIDKDGNVCGFIFSDARGNRGGEKFPVFVKDGNILRLNATDSMRGEYASENFKKKKDTLLDRYSEEGKYPFDLAFQRFVIEHALRKAGDNRKVNYYLAVLNNQYVYNGALDAAGACVYNEIDGQELITFLDMNETTEEYQHIIKTEIAKLESYISTLHDVGVTVPVGRWCAWGKNTECLYWSHCFQKLRSVPDCNKANSYLNFRGFKQGNIDDKFQLINEGYYKFDDIPSEWLEKENHLIQRDCYDNGKEHIDNEKMQYWFNLIEYPIYHFDFETFPCPLPRFRGENPYRQSAFEFSLHVERTPGVCDKQSDNFVFLNNECFDDEREALVRAIIDHFEFNEDGTLHGTMLAQNTSFERGRLEELAIIFPQYADKLLAIRDKSMDLIHLLKTNRDLYTKDFGKDRAAIINYYHKDLSGSYSIKKTLPVLVPELTYKGMDVGNGVQAYIAYINYDTTEPTVFDDNHAMNTKGERRDALKLYCQQDTWAMVEILRAVRKKLIQEPEQP